MKKIIFAVSCFWVLLMILITIAWATPSPLYFENILTYNGHTYAITKNSMTWDEARILAEQHGGYLVTINDSSENQFLSANYGSGVPWIGLNDIQNEGTWEWANGGLPTYWNWAPGEPNNAGNEDCGKTNWGPPGVWNDFFCSGSDFAIVEWDVLLPYIDFDDVSDGMIIDSQYSELGVTFYSLINCTTPDPGSCETGCETGHAYAREAIPLAASSPNVVSIFGPQCSDPCFDPTFAFAAEQGAAEAHFSTPQKSVSIDAKGIQGLDPLGEHTERPFLQACGARGCVCDYLETVYYPYHGEPGWGTWQTLTITRPSADIAYVRFSSQTNLSDHPGGDCGYWTCGMYGMFDNLYFTADPDLLFSSLTAPATGGAGKTIDIYDTIKNQGAGTAWPSNTKFYLSTNSTYDVGDTYLEQRSVPSLPPGASDPGNTTVTIPPGTASGTYYIIARADANGVVEEKNENNNNKSKSIKIGPDLIVLSIVTNPYSPLAGQNVTVKVTVKNQGGGNAGAFLFDIYKHRDTAPGVYDYGDFTCWEPGLAAGATCPCVGTVSYSSAGTYKMWAQVDSGQQVAETNEANNTKYKSLTIQPPKPDLIVSSLTAPATGGAGLLIYITETTKNQGEGTAVASTTKFYISTNSTYDAGDTYLEQRSVPSLPPGALSSYINLPVTIPPGTTAGTYYIIARADANGVVVEKNEINNNRSKSIKVGPDLIVSSLVAPSTAHGGQTVTISDTTKNNGGGGAPASTTRYYFSTDTILDAGDYLLGSRPVPALPAGASHTGSISGTLPSVSITIKGYIIAKADGPNVIPETNENNNTRYKAITVEP
jgi:subtilase family serine protease